MWFKLPLLVLAGASLLSAQNRIAGEWLVRADYSFGNIRYSRLTVDGARGTFGGEQVEVTTDGSQISWTNDSMVAEGILERGRLRGELKFGDSAFPFTAERFPAPSAEPRTHEFEPTRFELFFSSEPEPVLRIAPGDTVWTWGVDAGGVDPKGVRRSTGGNPQTGPFYVEGAVPGDTLVIHIDKVRLNRDWARSGSSTMYSTLQPYHLTQLDWDREFNSRWLLDEENGVARLEEPTDKLRDFSVPLAPLVGCIGVAPPERWSIRTRDSGTFGGNMDYNQIREGTTVYLPVYQLGALLFIGDGHAAQGDGELTGDALETSMAFEFTVDVIKDQRIGHPLAENDEYIISIGIGGSLEQALQMATSGLMRWLDRDYGLSASEAAIVMGFAIEYDVVDLVGTQVSIAAKVPKSALDKLSRVTPR